MKERKKERKNRKIVYFLISSTIIYDYYSTYTDNGRTASLQCERWTLDRGVLRMGCVDRDRKDRTKSPCFPPRGPTQLVPKLQMPKLHLVK
jgi:hypothetical protein